MTEDLRGKGNVLKGSFYDGNVEGVEYETQTISGTVTPLDLKPLNFLSCLPGQYLGWGCSGHGRDKPGQIRNVGVDTAVGHFIATSRMFQGRAFCI